LVVVVAIVSLASDLTTKVGSRGTGEAWLPVRCFRTFDGRG
jgi:hypothetical protein